MRGLSLLVGGLVLCGPAALAGAASAPQPLVSAGPSIGSCPVFPAHNYWNTDISTLPVDTRSETWLSHMSTGRNLHPDFGPSYSTTEPDYGIPITRVTNAHPTMTVRFDYAAESDAVRYPLVS